MATVDKSIDLTINSDEDTAPVDSYYLRQARRFERESQDSKPKLEVIDLTGDSKTNSSSRAAPRSLPNAMPLSPGPAKQLPLNRSSSKKPRTGSSNANGKDQDHPQSASSPPRKVEDSGARLSSPSAKRQAAMGATSDLSPLRKHPLSEKSLRQKKLSPPNGSLTPSLSISSINGSSKAINGDRQDINGDHTKSSSKPVNGHKSTDDTPQPHPAVSSVRTNGRGARKSSAPDRLFAIPSLGTLPGYSSSLNKAPFPRVPKRVTSTYPQPREDVQTTARASPRQQLETQIDKDLSQQLNSNDRVPTNNVASSKGGTDPPQLRDDVIMSDAPASKFGEQSAEHPLTEEARPAIVKEETPSIPELSISEFEQRLRHYMVKLRADHQYHVRVRIKPNNPWGISHLV